MIKLTKIAFASILFAALAVGVVACGDDKAPTEPAPRPLAMTNDPMPSPPTAPEDQDVELTAVEQNELRAQLAAQANDEITTENADRFAAALESEIEADLAAEE